MHTLVAVVDGVLLTANEAVIVRPPVDRSFICLLVLVSMNRNEWHLVAAAQDWPHGQRDNGPVPQRYIGERCRFLVSVGGNKHTINLRYHDVHFIMCLQIPCQPACAATRKHWHLYVHLRDRMQERLHSFSLPLWTHIT